MPKGRYKIILSDLHLGFGFLNPDGSRNILEEFYQDDPFSQFLDYYSADPYAKAEVELILNGDILNHLHTDPSDPDANSLTERVALERTEKIIRGHPKFFDALARFARPPNRKIIYLMGNHDIGVAWPRVQQLLRERIHPELRFHLKQYRADGMHIEHGNQFLIDNRVDWDNLFLTRGQKEPVLKMPWGSFFAIHIINALKRERPYVGKVFPFNLYLRWALTHDTLFALKTILQLILYFLKLNFIRDPKRNFSLKDTWRILREFSFPLELDKQAKKILMENPDIRFISFGHTHHARYRQFAPGKEYINTGSWNDLIGLDIGNFGHQLCLTFAEICIDGSGSFSALLKQWKGRYREVDILQG